MARLGFKLLAGTEVMHLQPAPHFSSDYMQGYGITHNHATSCKPAGRKRHR